MNRYCAPFSHSNVYTTTKTMTITRDTLSDDWFEHKLMIKELSLFILCTRISYYYYFNNISYEYYLYTLSLCTKIIENM